MPLWKDRLHTSDQTMLDFRLTDFPMHYFAAIQKRNQLNLDRKLDRLGLSPLDWRILAALHQHGSVTINDLSEMTVFDRFKVSRGANRLIERGYVETSQGHRDGRKRRLELTDEGRTIYRAAYKVVAQIYQANFDGLTDSEFDQLLHLVRRIKDNVYRVEEY